MKTSEKQITKVKEKRPVKAVKMLVLVLSVVAHSGGSCTTCIGGKRRRAKRKQMVRGLMNALKKQLTQQRKHN